MQNPDQTLVNLIGLIVFFSPVTIPIIWWSAREFALHRALNELGIVTKGLITYRQKAPFGFAGLISYKYSAPNKRNIVQWFYHRRHGVSSDTFDGLEHSSEATVAYLPNHPQISRLAEEDADYYTRNYTCLQAGCMMIICPPLVLIWMVAYYISLAMYYGDSKPKFTIQ